jgi:hypothetical protein
MLSIALSHLDPKVFDEYFATMPFKFGLTYLPPFHEDLRQIPLNRLKAWTIPSVILYLSDKTPRLLDSFFVSIQCDMKQCMGQRLSEKPIAV